MTDEQVIEVEKRKKDKYQKMKEYISDITEEELDEIMDYVLTLHTQHI